MKTIQAKNKPKIFLVFCFVVFALLLNQNSSLGAENELGGGSQICSMNKKNLMEGISRINDYKDELEDTMMYRTLSIADWGLSLYWGANDLAYRSIQVLLMGAQALKSKLPLGAQPLLSAALTCANDHFYYYQLCQFPTKYIVQQTAGYTALLLMNLSMSSDMSGPRHKELDVLIYYLSKRAGWSYDELLTSGWRLFNENLLMTQEQQPFCDPLGEELCFYHPTPGADLDKQSILPIVYNITNGWKQVSLCHQGNETEKALCASHFLENLPNFAPSESDVYEKLYNNTEFLGSGEENIVYKIALSHHHYGTPTIVLKVWEGSFGEYSKDRIPNHLEIRSKIKHLSANSLNIDDFFPKIYSVYFSSISNGVKFFQALCTEMAFLEKSFTDFSQVPHEFVVEYALMEYGLSLRGLTNLDNHFGNIGLARVSYSRLYSKGEKIYAMNGTHMPQTLDWDKVIGIKDNSSLRYFSEHGSFWWNEKLFDCLSEKTEAFAGSIARTFRANRWFSSQTQKFLEEYLVTPEQIKHRESEGEIFKYYDLGE